jgi:hypothetical protein
MADVPHIGLDQDARKKRPRICQPKRSSRPQAKMNAEMDFC